jgi:hypothetical protein
MSSVNVNVKDLDRIIRNITDIRDALTFSRGISFGIKATLDRIGSKILETLKKETPVGDETRPDFHQDSQFHTSKTHLRDMWKWKVEVKGTKLEGFAYVSSEKLNNLIDLLEAGSPRHTIRASAGGVLRFYIKRGAEWELAYANSVDHPGFNANKFTDRAQDKSQIHIEKLASSIQQEVNRLIKRK